MTIKSVCFQGELKQNCLKVKVNENYCSLRAGKWRFRLDSLSLTVLPIGVHFSVGCSLLQSQQNIDGQLVSAATPLHVFSVQRTTAGKVQVLSPGDYEWHEFNNGSQEFQLEFRPLGPITPPDSGRKEFATFVCGIIQFC
jgi:hypothetical protein